MGRGRPQGPGGGGLGRAIRYLRYQRRPAILAYGALIIATLAQLAVPQLVQNMINAVTSGRNPVYVLGEKSTRFKIKAGGRTRAYRMQGAEPEPGRVLTESDTESSLVTTFTVSPLADGSRVRIASVWQGARGFGGLMERLFAPRVLRKLYADELALLDGYARKQASG